MAFFDIEKNNKLFNNDEKIHSLKTSCDVLHMTSSQDTLLFKYSSRPSVWGPKFWYILHNSSVFYPKHPTRLAMMRMIQFLQSIPYLLPCSDCRNHAIDYMNHLSNETMLDKVSSQKKLIQFLVDFHNHVNIRTNKQKVNIELIKDNTEEMDFSTTQQTGCTKV